MKVNYRKRKQKQMMSVFCVMKRLLLVMTLSLVAKPCFSEINFFESNRIASYCRALSKDLCLHLAVKNGNRRMVNLLITAGADVNGRNPDNGSTPLHEVISNKRSNRNEIVSLLNFSGANPNLKNNLGDTPLHLATENNDMGMVSSFLQSGADINSLNRAEETPMHKAISSAHRGMAEALIERGANVAIRNNACPTPLIHLAQKMSNDEILGFLLESGATEPLSADEKEEYINNYIENNFGLQRDDPGWDAVKEAVAQLIDSKQKLRRRGGSDFSDFKLNVMSDHAKAFIKTASRFYLEGEINSGDEYTRLAGKVLDQVTNYDPDFNLRDHLDIISDIPESEWPYQFQTTKELDPKLESLFSTYNDLLKFIPASDSGHQARRLGLEAAEISDQAFSRGDDQMGEFGIRTAETMLDLSLSLTPFVGWGKDVYEVLTGENLVSGEKLEPVERVIAGLGVGLGLLTAGYVSGGVIRAIKKSATFAEKFSSSKYKKLNLFVKNAEEKANKVGFSQKARSIDERTRVRRFKETLRQTYKTDPTGMYENGLEVTMRIDSAIENVTPTLGNKYVKELPEHFSFKDAFYGKIHQKTLEPGTLVFQAQRSGQKNPGKWVTSIKPKHPINAEELLNLEKYGNDASQIKAFIIKEKATVYSGKVRGGKGYQMFFHDVPVKEVLEKVDLNGLLRYQIQKN